MNCDSKTAFDAFGGEHLPQWFDDITSTKWLSAQEESVGSQRQVNLKTMKVKEHFLNWETNKRFTFYLEAATLPLVESMIEDCQFEDRADGKCDFKMECLL